MSDATLYERPYTGAYDEAVFAFVVAHPEPGPTYAEIQKLLFPEPPPRPVERPQSRRCPQHASSGVEPAGFGAMGLPLGIAIGMMF